MFLCSPWFLQAAASSTVMFYLLVAVTYAVYMGSIVLGCLPWLKHFCGVCNVAMSSLFGALF